MPVIVKPPDATPVIVTVQLPDESRVQVAATVPTDVSDEVKLTVPDGVFAGFVLSATVTLQALVPPTVNEAGQDTVAEVSSFTTVIAPDVPELPLRVESPRYVPVTVADPGATPVNMTEQLPDTNVQLASTVPTEVSEDAKLTMPDGVLAGLVVSDTVTVQVEAPSTLIEAGAQETTVDVLSSWAALTVILAEVPELPLRDESPSYVPVTVKEPGATPVIVIVHVLPDSVQLASTVPIPLSEDERVTLPDGTFAAFVVSATVTVQDAVRPIVTELAQTTLVEVSSLTTVIAFDVPELPLWVESPKYVAVTVAEPAATPMNVTEQPPADSVQLASTVPILVSEEDACMKPDGRVLAGFVVSETVTVQIEPPPKPMLIEEGLHATTVEVSSSGAGLTAIVPEVPVLPL